MASLGAPAASLALRCPPLVHPSGRYIWSPCTLSSYLRPALRRGRMRTVSGRKLSARAVAGTHISRDGRARDPRLTRGYTPPPKGLGAGTDGSFRLPRPRRQPPAPAEPPERPGEAILPRQGRGGALSPARRSSAGPPERRRRESTVERARSRRAQWCPQLHLLRQRATAGCAWAGPPTRCEAGVNRGFGGRWAGRGVRGAHRLERRGEGSRSC